MLIRVGFEIGLNCPQPTPMTTYLSIHPDRRGDIIQETGLVANREVRFERYRDVHGNDCRRCLVPEGRFEMRYDALVEDTGLVDRMDIAAAEVPVNALPVDTLVYLLPSRYCETEHLSDFAWKRFGDVEPGWARVQAICDYVHERLTFSYGYARATRTACQAHDERTGVCRDFAHLAVALCRCLNIPARYVNGFMGDIGVPADPAPMDFNAWFEAFIGGRWYTFDARHNARRIGRIVVARGRDAADIPLFHTFGQHQLDMFNVWTYEASSKVAEIGRATHKHSLIEPWHSPFWARHARGELSA
ncbi:transglutaminase-like domain-containing protein [Pararhizobium haloflavum]|uniref:transglutaminase-like domain-containing protein n=1 Tax=Pararhizobium haloflavum TaxID=2037914 RepID=UPI000C18862A|nr:transglutaminase family protein [Pararhizobium haloflavum]